MEERTASLYDNTPLDELTLLEDGVENAEILYITLESYSRLGECVSRGYADYSVSCR